MRIVCIQSSTAKKFEFDSESDKQGYISALGHSSFKTLPRGSIRCICLISDAFWLRSTPCASKWAIGPFCYKIIDVVCLEVRLIIEVNYWKFSYYSLSFLLEQEEIKCKGRLNLFHLPCDVRVKLLSIKIVADKIEVWKSLYKIDFNSENLDRGLRYLTICISKCR